MRTYSEVDHDENPLEQDEGQGQRRLRHHSVGQMILSIVAMVTGSASIIMMANNRAFPAFTLSPVAVGLLGLTTAILGLTMSKKRSSKEHTNNSNVVSLFVNHPMNSFNNSKHNHTIMPFNHIPV